MHFILIFHTIIININYAYQATHLFLLIYMWRSCRILILKSFFFCTFYKCKSSKTITSLQCTVCWDSVQVRLHNTCPHNYLCRAIIGSTCVWLDLLSRSCLQGLQSLFSTTNLIATAKTPTSCAMRGLIGLGFVVLLLSIYVIVSDLI